MEFTPEQIEALQLTPKQISKLIGNLRDEVATARKELEIERMRLSACGVVALADTPESAAQARDMLPDYRSASLSDVERRVDECIRLRVENQTLRDRIKVGDSITEGLRAKANNAAYAEEQLTHLAKFMGLQGMTWAHLVTETVSRIEKLESRLEQQEKYIQEEQIPAWKTLQDALPETAPDDSRPLVQRVLDAIHGHFGPGRDKQLTFGEALMMLKAGARVARAGWNGKGMWLALSCNGTRSVPAEKFWSPHNAEFARQNGGSATVLPSITMKTATGEILMGWLASQTDLLAEDWEILQE